MSLFGSKEKKVDAEFTFGVQSFKKIDGGEIVLTGRVDGTVRPGATVYIVNPGVDETLDMSTVEEIHMPSGTVAVTSDCTCGLVIKEIEKVEIRVGTVLYTKKTDPEKIHNAYIAAIGDAYVGKRRINFSEEELDNLSVIDLVECWRLFGWFTTKAGNRLTELEIKENSAKIEPIAKKIVEKILAADSVYVVYNKKTKEPHLFVNVARRPDGQYMCSAPDVLIVPSSYYSVMSKFYNTDEYELKKIENGEDKKGIFNFLGTAFYINGAVGVAVTSDKTCIDGRMFVAPPDYSDLPEINRPITNPDLVRWMLLYFQLGQLDTDEKKTIGNLFYTFMSKELLKAKLLVPMKKEGEISAPDAEGKVVISKGTKIELAVTKGKDNNKAVKMYTDWIRLREEFNEDWEALIQPVSGMLTDDTDVIININSKAQLGCYLNKEIYANISKQIEDLG